MSTEGMSVQKKKRKAAVERICRKGRKERRDDE